MNFLRLQKPADLPPAYRGGVVAIGNFDGVHRGHQAVLCAAVRLANERKVPAIVLTFEPHPRTFFRPENPVFRLTNADTKSALLQSIGFDCVVEQPFDGTLSSTPAAEFVGELLVNALGVSAVVTGYDFHFGKGREGNLDFLKKAGRDLGFEANIVEAYSDEGGSIVSSSRIRECLAAGNITEANALLGYSYRVSGEIIKGKQLGRTLGYPTANIALPEETDLAHGIYAVRARLEDGSMHSGVASYGRRPTFDNGQELLETFIFDFSSDLYGQPMTVFLESRLRGEEKFDDVEALVQQMDRDSEEARAFLNTLGPDQGIWPMVQC